MKYGINNVVLFESETEIPGNWLPALGAANITELEGEESQLDRTETYQKLSSMIQCEVSGQIEAYEGKNGPVIDLGDRMFISEELELCLTQTKTTVKSPLKPSSTVKQLAGKNGVKVELCHMMKEVGRSIKVSSSNKQVYSGSIPITFW